MRQMFLGFVLVSYIALAPTGRPAIDLFDSDAIALSERAHELQKAWASGQYGDMLNLCLPEQRNAAIGRLLEIAEKGEPDAHGHSAGLAPEAVKQVAEYKVRLKKLVDTEPRTPAGDEVRIYRSNQAVLYTEVLRWIREADRLPEPMRRVFTGAVHVKAFDRIRGNVQFSAPDGAESAIDPVLTFENVRGRWMNALDFK